MHLGDIDSLIPLALVSVTRAYRQDWARNADGGECLWNAMAWLTLYAGDVPELFPDPAAFSSIQNPTDRMISVAADYRRRMKARLALERAWRKQPRGASVALRLARQYASENERGKAAAMPMEALERFPDDKGAHFEMDRFLLRSDGELSERIGEHLGRSYSPGDRNYDARHLHAQYLFHVGEARKAEALFADVEGRAPPEFRERTRDPDKGLANHLRRGVGRVVKKDSTYCFVRSPDYGSDIYGNERDSDTSVWDTVRSGSAVDFKVMFRRGGPIAHDIRPVSD